ncbi:hypothetical protein [Kineococcus sp. SYSU DK003]|uniref:hypothetical protein n=1 Tax=Kineococcus sp. SYSU DK003 TaxID=3383124 RepID=UPI003D7C7549
MSTEPSDPSRLHRELLAVLRGGSPTSPVSAPGPVPRSVDLITETATARQQQAVDAALAGDPLLVDLHDDGGAFLTALLAALAAAGREVALVPGAATAAARPVLAGLGLAHLLGDTPADTTRRGADLPPADPGRWLALLRELDTRNRAWFTGSDGVPSRFEAFAGLARLRAEHLHPPLLPAAAGWTAQERARVTGLLSRAPRTGEDPLRDVSEEQIAAAAGALADLPGRLGALAGLVRRLTTELGWREPRTLADVAAAPAVLARVEEVLRTYVPAALHTDLDQARAILARQPRSLLSGEERERRRELKRLSALRHDGASFGPADVEALADVQRVWAAHAAGAPTTWPARGELETLLEPLRRDLAQVTSVLPDVPADPEVPALEDLAERIRRTAAAVRSRQDEAALSAEGLQDLAAAVPAGADADEIARLVEGTTWRALAEAPDAGGPDVEGRVREFRRLDDLRRARAVRELQLALSGARAQPVRVTDSPGPVAVLVVDDAHRRDAAQVAALAGDSTQLVLLGSADAEPGSAWTRARAVVPTADLRPPQGGTSALRDAVATALEAAGVRTAPGTRADLELGEGPTRVLLDLEDSLGGLCVQDREVALPALRRREGNSYRLLRGADWFADHRGATRRLVEDVRALEEVAPTPAPVAAPVVPAPVEGFPKGLGTAEDAQRAVTDFVTGLGGGHPNIDQTPPATIDAAIALSYATLGVKAADTAVLDAAMEVLTYRRRGTKVLRAFKESLQRTKKRMRGAGVRIP